MLAENAQTADRFVYDPDLRAISDLMRRTWRPPCWDYTAETLAAYIRRPSGDPTLSVGMFCNDVAIGYIAYVPYDVWCSGHKRRAVYATFWTADAACSGKGRQIALRVRATAQEWAQQKGIAAFLGVTHHGSPEAEKSLRAAERLGAPMRPMLMFRQLVGTVTSILRRLGGGPRHEVTPYDVAHRDSCAILCGETRRAAMLARELPNEDIDFVFRDRPGTRTWLYLDGGQVRALINVMLKGFIGARHAVNAYVEHALFGDLSHDERQAFVGSIACALAEENVSALCMPELGYCDVEPFLAGGCRRSLETFQLHYIPFDRRVSWDDISSVYMDVF